MAAFSEAHTGCWLVWAKMEVEKTTRQSAQIAAFGKEFIIEVY